MSLAFETLGETIAVFDKSGEVVSTTKHLYSVFKEAQEAYKKARAGFVDQYNAAFNAPTQAEPSQPCHRQLAWHGNDGVDYVQPPADEGIRRHARNERPVAPNRDSGRDYFNSKPDVHQFKSLDEPFKQDLTHHSNASVILTPLDVEGDSVDADLAYGEYHAETFERVYRNAEEDMKKLMSKTQKMLIEAKCAEASAVATINHLQSNPEAMAAIALTLAEVSKLAKSVGPRIINALKVAFPSAFALLACPQFLVASSVGIGITIVMIGGYKIIKRIRAAYNEDGAEQPAIEDKRPFPSHLVDDFAPPQGTWSPPPASLHSPASYGDNQWDGIPRMASRLASRPSIDRSEMYELESKVTGVNSWLKGLDTDGSRIRNKPEGELMTPLAACESGFLLDKAGNIRPPPQRHARNGHGPPTRDAALARSQQSSDSDYPLSASPSSSQSRSPTKSTHDRPSYNRRYDSGVELDEAGYTRDGRYVKVRGTRAMPQRRNSIAEDVEHHRSRAPHGRESRPTSARGRNPSSTERRSPSRRRGPSTLTDGAEGSTVTAQPTPDRRDRTVRPVRSNDSFASPPPLSRRPTGETTDFSQPFAERDQPPPQRVKGSKTAKLMGILTFGLSNREGRASRQSQPGSWRRSRSATDANRSTSRSGAHRAADESTSRVRLSQPVVLQRKLQEQSRGSAAEAQAWYERRERHDRRVSRLNPRTDRQSVVYYDD